MDDHEASGFCCGTCELADRTARGEVRFEHSPPLVVGDGDGDTDLLIADPDRDGNHVRRFALRRGMRFVVGRAADLVISSPAGDRRIFAIEVTDTGSVFVEDVGSACGTLVNGERVKRRQLGQRDIIHAAMSVYLRFLQGAHRDVSVEPGVFANPPTTLSPRTDARGPAMVDRAPVAAPPETTPRVALAPETTPRVARPPETAPRGTWWQRLRARVWPEQRIQASLEDPDRG